MIKQFILSLFCHHFWRGCNCVFFGVAAPILVPRVCWIDQGASLGDGRHESEMFYQKFRWLCVQNNCFVTFLPSFLRRPHLGVFGWFSNHFGPQSLLGRSRQFFFIGLWAEDQACLSPAWQTLGGSSPRLQCGITTAAICVQKCTSKMHWKKSCTSPKLECLWNSLFEKWWQPGTELPSGDKQQ